MRNLVGFNRTWSVCHLHSWLECPSEVSVRRPSHTVKNIKNIFFLIIIYKMSGYNITNNPPNFHVRDPFTALELKVQNLIALANNQGGNFDIEPLKTTLVTNEATVFAGLYAVLGAGAATFGSSSVQLSTASTNLKTTEIIDMNSWRASTALFSLRDTYVAHWVDAAICTITTAYDLGGLITPAAVSAVVIGLGQTPITNIPALQTVLSGLIGLFNAVSARDVVTANATAAALIAGFPAIATAIVQQLLAAYIAAGGAFSGAGQAAVATYMGNLIGAFGPVVASNLNAIAALASQPRPVGPVLSL